MRQNFQTRFYGPFMLNTIVTIDNHNDTSFCHLFYSRFGPFGNGLMRLQKVLSQISLSIPPRLIRDDTLRLYGFFNLKEVFSKQKSRLDGEFRHWWACADCIKLGYPRTRLLRIFISKHNLPSLYVLPFIVQPAKYTPILVVTLWRDFIKRRSQTKIKLNPFD